MKKNSKHSSVSLVSDELQLQCESLESRVMLSSVQLLAAGVAGTEQMQLQIDGVAVETFNLGTGAYEGAFQTFNYETPDSINASQIRVAFLNDSYDPANGLDANIRLDAIIIDGVRFETEATNVLSTGTWLPEDGLVTGFRQSEYLHTNGYFQFAVQTNPGPAPLTPGSVIINEIHYNPGPDGVVDPDAEFIELYNTTSVDIDLSGASFVGFTLVFAEGTVLKAGEYGIVSPSTAIAEATWGVTPIAQFAAGGISGSGELIQLVAADGTVIDEVNYLDQAPWVATPDGNGPSLELRDPALDNSVASSWAASIGSPTPGAVNSVFGQQSESPISNIVVTPEVVLPGQAFDISANIVGATTATLIYKVGFDGAEQSIAMTNVGQKWTATLPGQSAGELIRYRIVSDVAVAPFNDTINYFGLVVAPTDIVDNQLPVFQFWVNEAQFTELTTTELALTNTKIPAVIAFGNKVYDNATVRVRGGDFSRLNHPKKSLKFELPKGFTIDIGTEGSHPIDEFGVNADFSDWSVVTPDISWDVFNAETDSFTSSFFMHVRRNSGFHGVFRFQELYDGAWREAAGFNGADEFYQAAGDGFGPVLGFDKEDPDDGDFTSIQKLNDVLNTAPSATKTAYLYRHIDIPALVNHMALSTLMRHDDQAGQNFYMWLDADTQTWKIVEWDLDRTWVFPADGNGGTFTTPEPISALLLNSIFEVPEFQDMYWRRIQTLVDTYLSDDQLINRHEELLQQIGATNSSLDFAKWNRNDVFSNRFWQEEFNQGIQLRRDAFANEARMPGTASGNYNIVINELHYNPLEGQAEFIELFNNSTESVDLSGWKIDAIGLTIAYGTVILPGQSVVFTDNYVQFKSQYKGNIFVGGQYSGGLSGSGELVTLVDKAGNVVDSVEYDDAGAWPTSPDGGGFSLALSNPSLDNSLATSWTASIQANGSPGLSNSTIIQPNTINIFAAGQTGNEVVSLEVAGQVVATYLLSDFGGQAGDLANRRFVTLSYVSPTPLAASDIRINFLNDAVDAATGADNNVAIDRIEIDQTIFETEAADVFSTGTYLPADGVVPGFRQNEILHTNGYFQYGAANLDRAPIANADTATTVQGQPVTINVLGNDSDPDAGDTFTISQFTQPANGTVTLVNGALVYTPSIGYTGTDAFTYTIVDAGGLSAVGQVSITVTPPENLNVVKILAAGATGNEVISLEIAGQVVATYLLSDFGGQAGDLAAGRFITLTYNSPTPVAIGNVRVNFLNDVYDPANGIDFNVAIDRVEIGNLAFETEANDVYSTGSWKAEDGIVPGIRQSEVLNTTGYFQYGYVATNNAPIARNDQATTAAGQAVTIAVLGNDEDLDAGDTITIQSVTQPSNGSVVISNGSVVYTPNTGFTGSDAFSYTIADEGGLVATGQVAVTVTPAANPNAVTVFAAGVTGNEIISLEIAGQVVGTYLLSDFGGQAGDLAAGRFVPITFVSPVPVAIGDVRINFLNDVFDVATGVDYNVAIDRVQIGTATFETEAPDVYSTGTWKAEDGITPGFRQNEVLHTNGYFQYGFVETNSAPIARNDQATTTASKPVTIAVLGNDEDPDAGDSITIQSVSQPQNGVAVISNGTVVYTPNANFTGVDNFNYTIRDQAGVTVAASIQVTVAPAPSIIANGNVVRLFNLNDQAWLRGRSSTAETTTTNDSRTQWQLVQVSGNDYRLRNVSTGRYLDGDLLSVDLNSSATATGTVWRFSPAPSGGGYYLYNVAYGRYLDSNGSSTSVTYDVGSLENDDIWIVSLA